MSPLRAFVVIALLLSTACSSDSTSSNGTIIHLTQAQAASLGARMTQIAPIHSELAWLADSASLVLKAGAEADVIAVTTNLADGPFYAVGLQRAVTSSTPTSTSSFATFHVIAFNDPSNPTDFIIVNGFKQVAGATAPIQVSGSFGGNAVAGHLFHIQGATISSYRATTGTATFASAAPAGACIDFQAPTNVTCVQSALLVSFTIADAVSDGGVLAASRHAALDETTVAGIRLGFTFTSP
jgi:hypothetical protein